MIQETKILKHTVIYKKRGETPLEAIRHWKIAHPEYKDIAAAYAGRLDPMAEGKLLVLLGEECKNLTAYTKLDKEYEVELLLDIKTDTGDVLGLAEYAAKETVQISKENISTALSQERGSRSHKYPIYSSKTVKGKPLFLYALEGTLDSITIPEHIENFYELQLCSMDLLTVDQLQTLINESLAIVPRSNEPSKVLGADFRQDAVRARWRELFDKIQESHSNDSNQRSFLRLRIRVVCGSGAYMRTLVERIAASLGTTGVALSIKRTKIGKYHVLGIMGFWSKTYR